MAEEANQSPSIPPESQSEAVIEYNVAGGAESTCNNGDATLSGSNAESSALTSDSGGDASLEAADELVKRGSKAVKDGDFAEATDCFSRALEIRAARFGELAPECINAYYKYGCALLYKAQEEADPLGSVPKKEAESQQASAKISANGESSTTSVASTATAGGQHERSENQDGAVDDASAGNNQGDDDDSEDEDTAEADEDESDLDLAWKMLDIARLIIDKTSGETREKVDILSALAEVSLEREDIEASLSDYERALSILEKLVEPDDRQIAELNFRICLCLEIGSKPEEAIPYCQKAISVCKSRVQRLMDETKCLSASASFSAAAPDNPLAEREAEIETVSGLASELEKKLEDLQLVAANPSSVLTELLGLVSSKAKEMGQAPTAAAMSSSQMARASSIGSFDSQTASTAHTNGPATGVTHLGVVGRGVKRVTMSSTTSEASASKKPAVGSSSSKQDGGSCS